MDEETENCTVDFVGGVGVCVDGGGGEGGGGWGMVYPLFKIVTHNLDHKWSITYLCPVVKCPIRHNAVSALTELCL